MNKLEQLKSMTKIVADTGDIEAIKCFKPLDATTNPSLLFKAVQLPQYQDLVQEAIQWSQAQGGTSQQQLGNATDKLAVLIGKEIIACIPGRVSTEVDARLSFDTERTVKKARRLIDLYDQVGIDSSRVFIKIASTWEGIRAAEILEKEAICCNLTLLFGFNQAVACAHAGVTLISPFVGRILDWHKKNGEQQCFLPDEDPGVLSVSKIYHYYKQHDFNTIIMGASFRNTGQIEALAGCDQLTISPELLCELENDKAPLPQKLDADQSKQKSLITDQPETEAEFRLGLNQDRMATEKLSEGIRNFIKDQDNLEQWLTNY